LLEVSEITGTGNSLILNCFPKNQNWQFSGSKMFKELELVIISKIKYPLNTSIAMFVFKFFGSYFPPKNGNWWFSDSEMFKELEPVVDDTNKNQILTQHW
jgi:hypothetical protein